MKKVIFVIFILVMLFIGMVVEVVIYYFFGLEIYYFFVGVDYFDMEVEWFKVLLGLLVVILGYGYCFNCYFELGIIVLFKMDDDIIVEVIDIYVIFDYFFGELIFGIFMMDMYMSNLNSFVFVGIYVKFVLFVVNYFDVYVMFGGMYGCIEYDGYVNENGYIVDYFNYVLMIVEYISGIE